MAQFLILIYEDESSYQDATPEVLEGVLRAHAKFTEQVPELGGKIVSAEALQPSPAARTIRGDAVSDGTFVATKEVLGGYYLVDAPDLDTAIAIGKLCPAQYGGVEVRPIQSYE